MRDFILMTDSCCDLPAQLADDLEVEVLPLSLIMGGNTYRNYLDGREISFSDFYNRIRTEQHSTTSAVSVGEFEDAMRAILKDGKDILYIGFSSPLSTTYQSACIAADGLREEFPEATILTVDSQCASMGQGLLVYQCGLQRQKGRSIQEVYEFAEQTKGSICHWITVEDLFHLKRGGRVSGATALFGTMLSIKPILHVDDEGHLLAVSKCRGRKASLLALVDAMEKTATNPAEQTVFISHGDCEADAQFVADEIKRRFGTKDIRINFAGPVVGNHTGAGMLALFFMGTPR